MEGIGLAPRLVEDMYSGCTEAFSLIAGLTFFHYYITCLDHQAFRESILQCFCDNIGVLTNVMDLLNPLIIQPNDTTNNDHNVYMEISNLATWCSPFQLQFLHVKGHQDQKAKCPITIIEAFNVDCNHCTKQYTREATQSSMALGNLALSQAQHHFQIAGKLICCNVRMALQDATMLPPYHHYLKQKLQWTDHDLQQIHWNALISSLSYFQSEDQCQLVLFLNEKLPLCTLKVILT